MIIEGLEPGDFLRKELDSTSEYAELYDDLARIRRASITNARDSQDQYEEEFWRALRDYAGITAETMLGVESISETDQTPELLERRHRDNLIRMNNFSLNVGELWMSEYENRVGDELEPYYEGEGPNTESTAEMIQTVDDISTYAFSEASQLPNGGIGDNGDFEEFGNATVDPLKPKKFSSTPDYDVHQDYFSKKFSSTPDYDVHQDYFWQESFGASIFHGGI